MRRINIEVIGDIADDVVMSNIADVMLVGRISTLCGKSCYCSLTSFRDGTAVTATVTKAGNDSFTVYREIQ